MQCAAARDHRSTSASKRVQDFVDSQRRLTPRYAAEGHQVIAAWKNSDAGDFRPQSPMLVPRTVAPDGLIDKSNATPRPCSRTPPELLSNLQQTSCPQVISDKLANPGLLEHKWANQDPAVSDGSERSKRLAQRRNRKRARRATMATGGEGTVSISNPRDADRLDKKEQTAASNTKSKRAKTSSALLLMQTFSGQNMGKSRLTMKPSSSVGVFNKGKASIKVSTKQQRSRRLDPGIVFSESIFLAKPRAAGSDSDTTTGGSDGSDESELHSVHSVMERKKHHNDRDILQQANVTSPYKETPKVRTGAKDNSVVSVKLPRRTSPAWDIEQQTASSPNSHSALTGLQVPRSPFITSKPNPTIINVGQCSWNSNLRRPKAHTSHLLETLATPPPKPPMCYRATSSHRNDLQTRIESPALSAVSRGNQDSMPSLLCREVTDFSTYPYIDRLHSPDLSERVVLSPPSEHGDYIQTSQASLFHFRSPSNSPEILLHEDELTGARFTRAEDTCEDWSPGVPSYLEPSLYDAQIPDITRSPLVVAELDTWDDPDFGYDDGLAEPAELFAKEEPVNGTRGSQGYGYEPSYLVLDEELGRDDVHEYFYNEYEQIPDNQLDKMPYWTPNNEQALCWDLAEGETEEDEFQSYSNETTPEDDVIFDQAYDDVTDDYVDPAPSLVRIITEASLESDLAKSISNHWGAARRF